MARRAAAAMQDVRCAPRPARLSLRGRHSIPQSNQRPCEGLILTRLGYIPWLQTPAFPSFSQATVPSSVLRNQVRISISSAVLHTKAIKLFLDSGHASPLIQTTHRTNTTAAAAAAPCKTLPKRRLYFRRGLRSTVRRYLLLGKGTGICKKGLKY